MYKLYRLSALGLIISTSITNASQRHLLQFSSTEADELMGDIASTEMLPDELSTEMLPDELSTEMLPDELSTETLPDELETSSTEELPDVLGDMETSEGGPEPDVPAMSGMSEGSIMSMLEAMFPGQVDSIEGLLIALSERLDLAPDQVDTLNGDVLETIIQLLLNAMREQQAGTAPDIAADGEDEEFSWDEFLDELIDFLEDFFDDGFEGDFDEDYDDDDEDTLSDIVPDILGDITADIEEEGEEELDEMSTTPAADILGDIAADVPNGELMEMIAAMFPDQMNALNGESLEAIFARMREVREAQQPDILGDIAADIEPEEEELDEMSTTPARDIAADSNVAPVLGDGQLMDMLNAMFPGQMDGVLQRIQERLNLSPDQADTLNSEVMGTVVAEFMAGRQTQPDIHGDVAADGEDEGPDEFLDALFDFLEDFFEDGFEGEIDEDYDDDDDDYDDYDADIVLGDIAADEMSTTPARDVAAAISPVLGDGQLMDMLNALFPGQMDEILQRIDERLGLNPDQADTLNSQVLGTVVAEYMAGRQAQPDIAADGHDEDEELDEFLDGLFDFLEDFFEDGFEGEIDDEEEEEDDDDFDGDDFDGDDATLRDVVPDSVTEEPEEEELDDTSTSTEEPFMGDAAGAHDKDRADGFDFESNGDGAGEGGYGEQPEVVSIHLSQSTMANIWVALITFMCFNLTLFWCYCRRNNKARVYTDDERPSSLPLP